jgi:hypothetical protein
VPRAVLVLFLVTATALTLLLALVLTRLAERIEQGSHDRAVSRLLSAAETFAASRYAPLATAP